jgi:hypothetical protein
VTNLDLRSAEFAALRTAISTRGTVRVVITILTITIWASLTLVLALFSDLPLAVLVPYAVLFAGFEAIHALHVSVERIGRYLQVYYERDPDGPQWETAAMAVGPVLPGGGVDPLFSGVFIGAAILNVAASLPGAPIWQELAVLGLCHVTFVIRILGARRAAARQRAAELEGFRAVLLRERDRSQ